MVQLDFCLHLSLQFFDADIWNVQSNKCNSFGFEWTKHQRDAKRKCKWNSGFALIKHVIALFVIITDKLKKLRSYIHLNILNCTASVSCPFTLSNITKQIIFNLKSVPTRRLKPESGICRYRFSFYIARNWTCSI